MYAINNISKVQPHHVVKYVFELQKFKDLKKN